MSDLRICKVCGETKPLTKDFYSNTNKSEVSFRKICNCCRNKRSQEYYQKTRDVRLKAKRRFYSCNKEKFYAYAANRKSHIALATPDWELEFTFFVYEEALSLSALRNELTKIKHAVDHDIPLRGVNVCGLHVWNNFRVIPYTENQRKSNKYA